jgi:hypothetical protein
VIARGWQATERRGMGRRRGKRGYGHCKGAGSTAGAECLVGEESGRQLGFQGFEQKHLSA